tara:strand:+ start:51 stop:881 length:831 start_codon:yes stop_codon:yes gene_type:complete
MSLFSLALGVMVVLSGYIENRFESLDALICHPPNGHNHPGLLQVTMYLFYLSKFIEFTDTFLLILGGKPIIWLHLFHHSTTMSLCYAAFESGSSLEIVVVLLNCLVHTVMYLYFALPQPVLKPYITRCQMLQFIIVLAGLLYHTYTRFTNVDPCGGTLLGDVLGISVYFAFFVMFAHFYVKQYLVKSSKASQTRKDAALKSEMKGSEAKKISYTPEGLLTSRWTKLAMITYSIYSLLSSPDFALHTGYNFIHYVDITLLIFTETMPRSSLPEKKNM